MLQALPYSRSIIESGNIEASALISIGASEPNKHLRGDIILPKDPVYPILKLSFDDIPFESYIDDKKIIWYGPNEHDVIKALDFSREIYQKNSDAFIAVHCEQGKSRSAAITLAILSQLAGKGKEEYIVLKLLKDDINQQFCFNPLIIKIADRLLNNSFALEKNLEKYCPHFVTWKKYWKNKGLV